MSAGIRSGVNWTRAKSRSRTAARERTRTVLPRPGTPSRRTWPPPISASRVRRMSSFWPTMKRPSSVSIASVISLNRSGVISSGPLSVGLSLGATDTRLLSQILEVPADEVLHVLGDQLPVDLALGSRAIFGEVVGVGHQLSVRPAARAAGVPLRGAAAGALAGNVNLLGGGGCPAAAGARPIAAASATAGVD